MSTPRFFTDEDVYSAVATALRRAGIDAVSTPEAGRRGLTDESQLAWAEAEARVLVTFNVAHFAELHANWIRQPTQFRHMPAEARTCRHIPARHWNRLLRSASACVKDTYIAGYAPLPPFRCGRQAGLDECRQGIEVKRLAGLDRNFAQRRRAKLWLFRF